MKIQHKKREKSCNVRSFSIAVIRAETLLVKHFSGNWEVLMSKLNFPCRINGFPL